MLTRIYEHIAQIEEFIGYEFGEPPRIGTDDEAFKILFEGFCPAEKLTPEMQLVMKLRFEKYKQLFSGGYDSKEHALFLYDNNPSSLVMFHELAHAYMRNHWPGFDKMWTASKRVETGDMRGLEKYFINNALAEGFADFVALGCAEESEESRIKRFAFNNPEHFHYEISQKVMEVLCAGNGSIEEREILFESITRGVGYNYVNFALKNNKEKHRAYHALILKRPKKVLGLFS